MSHVDQSEALKMFGEEDEHGEESCGFCERFPFYLNGVAFNLRASGHDLYFHVQSLKCMANLTMDKDGMKFAIAWTLLRKTNKSTLEKRIIQHVHEPNFMDIEQNEFNVFCRSALVLKRLLEQSHGIVPRLTDLEMTNDRQEPNFTSIIGTRPDNMTIQCILLGGFTPPKSAASRELQLSYNEY